MMEDLIKAALNAFSIPASVPVCDDTALAPALEFPDLRIIIGFLFEILLVTERNSEPFLTPSK